MTEVIGTAASGHPDLNLTSDEKRFYEQLLKEADPEGFGAVSGDVAVKFFERTKLPPDVLGQIWQIADNQNRGFLTPAGFGVALRLIGHAQSGRVPTSQVAAQPAVIPRFDGMQPQAVAPQPPPQPSSPVQTGTPPIRVPALTPDKAAEYSGLFERSGADNGMLSGFTAKQIFERARLPNDVLGRIWGLSDMQGRGSLDVTEFTIAMHLLASYKSGAMRGVPNTLPPGLYEAAQRRGPSRMSSGSRPASGAPVPSGIPPSMASYNVRPQSPITRQQASTPMSAQSTGDAWAVTSADKARFDTIFASIDKQGRGFITGDQAVEFFTNARLPEEILAQIWDLSDINSEGQLSRDEFSVAMYLIRQQRATKDGRGALPSQLPQALIPPSLRKQVIPPSQTTAPAFENAPPPTKPRSAAEDLFDLEGFGSAPQNQVQSQTQASAPAPAPMQPAQLTGSRDAELLASPPPLPPTSASQSDKFRPFIPSSTFGRSLAPDPRSPGPAQPSPSRTAPKDNDDLLGDADPETTRNISSDAADLANLSNQVTNLAKQTTDLQATRGQASQELSQNTAQKRAFESRLASLRELYEKEAREVRTIQEQLVASKKDTNRLQQDIAMVGGTHQDLSTQHQQLRAALEADQKENAALKERIRVVNVEVEQLKPALEKAKSDARQQKGLVAINKKQLATNEGERDRLKAEITTAQQQLEEAKREIEESTKHIEKSKGELEKAKADLERSRGELEKSKVESERSKAEMERSKGELERSKMDAERSKADLDSTRKMTSQASVKSPATNVVSPALSMASNPFFRRTASGTSDRAMSPPLAAQKSPTEDHSAFDSIFGPSFGIMSPPAQTSFRNEEVHHDQTPSMTTPNVASAILASSPLDSDRDSIPSEAAEPPAPPPSKQITSAALPFRSPLVRGDSVSSSVRVAPPASRLSPATTPRAGTPPTITSSPIDRKTSREDDFAMADPDEEQESVKATLPGPAQQPKRDTTAAAAASAESLTDEVPGAFPGTKTPKSINMTNDINPTAIAAGAGVATLAAGTGIAAAITSPHHEPPPEKQNEDRSATAKESERPQSGFDNFFGGPPHQRTPSQQAADFDSAFASMPKDNNVNGSMKQGNREFPDLQEYDNDDDSSSDDSEEAPMAFDDNFGSPRQPKADPTIPMSAKAAGKQPEILSAVPAHLAVSGSGLGTTPSTSSLPGFGQQASPPTYSDAVPQDDPNHFPREYKGLLPEREDPTSPPPMAAGAVTSPPAAMKSPYGPETAKPRTGSASKSLPVPAPNKAAPFDFDSAFSGLGAAQVEESDEDDDDDDDVGVDAAKRYNQNTAFDPTFDSPPQSRSTTATSHPGRPSMYSAVTNGTTSSTAADKGTGLFNFDDSFAKQASPPPVSNTGPAPGTTHTNTGHDWDSMFASLSQPVPAQSTELTGSTGPQTSNKQFTAPSAPTGLAPPGTLAPPQPSSATASGAQTPVSPGPGASTTSLKPERPQPGRALTEAGEHDDPILKRLMSMGWSRGDSLKALEKYDYNIDKAADYLTFKS